MSILIKGLEMPETCMDCPCSEKFGCGVENRGIVQDLMSLGRPDWCPLVYISDVETNVFDESEIHENCTVQILKSSVTGQKSIGWWPNN